MQSSYRTHASRWLTDHVAPPETPADRICELWSLSECPIPLLENDYSVIKSVIANVIRPYREVGHTILYVWYLSDMLCLDVLHLGKREGQW